MNETRWQRWAAASGFVALAFGAAAVALERPWPSTSDPDGFPAFLAANRGAILAQSMLFVISAGVFMWFLGSLRSFLIEAEGATGRLSTLAFAAGMIGYGLNVVGQAPQITLTLPSAAGMPGLGDAHRGEHPAGGDVLRGRRGVVAHQGLPGLAGLARGARRGRRCAVVLRGRRPERSAGAPGLGKLPALPGLDRVAGPGGNRDDQTDRQAPGRHHSTGTHRTNRAAHPLIPGAPSRATLLRIEKARDGHRRRSMLTKSTRGPAEGRAR